MKVFGSVLTIILFCPCWVLVAQPQQAPGISERGIVESVEISGIDEDDLGNDVRKAIHALEGKVFDYAVADDLIQQIQAENSELTVTTRLFPGSTNDRIKVIFAVQKANAPEGGANINARYAVERVDVEGFDESRLKQAIRDEMKSLVGEKLDQEKANRILREINRQLRPKYTARKKVQKGSDRQHVVVVYEISKTLPIPFTDFAAQRFVYHSKQGFSVDFDADLNDEGKNSVFFRLSDDQDQLIERFAGFGGGFESRKVGTDRLGIALAYARFHERWQPSTVSSDRNNIYRERNTFDPRMTFAFDPRIRVVAGVSVSDLQIQYPAIHRANANAALASLIFHNVWGDAVEDKHLVDASYDFRSGNHEMDSDFIYTRHFARAQYVYSHRKDKLFLSFLAGSISGNAPLFERFSLGDSRTLRGWNKFDIAPAGGNRVIHASLQYGLGKESGNFDINGHKGRFGLGFHVFYDVGAVGNSGTPIQARHSAGFGFGAPDASRFFIELGFPIRSYRVQPTLSVGFRF